MAGMNWWSQTWWVCSKRWTEGGHQKNLSPSCRVCLCGWWHLGDNLSKLIVKDKITNHFHFFSCDKGTLLHSGYPAVQFNVYEECIRGICTCTHTINCAPVQLKPCRMYAECSSRGDIDPDWQYLMYGTIFGFNVINKDCNSEYECDNYTTSTVEPNKRIPGLRYL